MSFCLSVAFSASAQYNHNCSPVGDHRRCCVHDPRHRRCSGTSRLHASVEAGIGLLSSTALGGFDDDVDDDAGRQSRISEPGRATSSDVRPIRSTIDGGRGGEARARSVAVRAQVPVVISARCPAPVGKDLIKNLPKSRSLTRCMTPTQIVRRLTSDHTSLSI